LPTPNQPTPRCMSVKKINGTPCLGSQEILPSLRTFTYEAERTLNPPDNAAARAHAPGCQRSSHWSVHCGSAFEPGASRLLYYCTHLDRKKPPPPGEFPIYYVPSSRTVCKRIPLEGFVLGSSRGVLLHTVLDEGT